MEWTQTPFGPLKTSVIDGLRRYAEEGIPTGSFLRAVLENDLHTACEKADIDNASTLHRIVVYIHNELPAACWGGPKKVADWIAYKENQRNTKNLFPEKD